jgi:hypothetical protein
MRQQQLSQQLQEFSGHHREPDINESPGESIQNKNINGNPKDRIFTVMRELSHAAGGQEKFARIINVVFTSLKNNEKNSS